MTDDEITDAFEIEPEIPHRLDREIFETDTLLKTLLLFSLYIRRCLKPQKSKYC